MDRRKFLTGILAASAAPALSSVSISSMAAAAPSRVGIWFDYENRIIHCEGRSIMEVYELVQTLVRQSVDEAPSLQTVKMAGYFSNDEWWSQIGPQGS